MSLVVDETAGDLPVREVGLRGNVSFFLNFSDRHRVFRIPREQLEDLCTRLQEENNLLRQHSRTQEQKLRRFHSQTYFC
uniref:Uncharacterized protein n=1 Tax=Denticeps clupeoides TaxID=299321 RepID=A0AAY4CZF7_9TELE